MIQMSGHKLTYLGHATFLITTASGRTLLIDPWLSANPACPPAFKKLPKVDIVAVTHGHFDHTGDLLPVAREHSPKIVAILEMCQWLESKGIKNTMPMAKGGTQTVDGVALTMVHAVHSSSIQDDGKIVYCGDPAGFVIRLPGGPSIYHAGDTAVFGDMKLIADLYAPELACLPIGDIFTMDPRQAALAIRLLGVRHVIPMHYGTLPALTGTPEALREYTRDIAGLETYVLKPGESLG